MINENKDILRFNAGLEREARTEDRAREGSAPGSDRPARPARPASGAPKRKPRPEPKGEPELIAAGEAAEGWADYEQAGRRLAGLLARGRRVTDATFAAWEGITKATPAETAEADWEVIRTRWGVVRDAICERYYVDHEELRPKPKKKARPPRPFKPRPAPGAKRPPRPKQARPAAVPTAEGDVAAAAPSEAPGAATPEPGEPVAAEAIPPSEPTAPPAEPVVTPEPVAVAEPIPPPAPEPVVAPEPVAVAEPIVAPEPVAVAEPSPPAEPAAPAPAAEGDDAPKSAFERFRDRLHHGRTALDDAAEAADAAPTPTEVSEPAESAEQGQLSGWDMPKKA